MSTAYLRYDPYSTSLSFKDWCSWKTSQEDRHKRYNEIRTELNKVPFPQRQLFNRKKNTNVVSIDDLYSKYLGGYFKLAWTPPKRSDVTKDTLCNDTHDTVMLVISLRLLALASIVNHFDLDFDTTTKIQSKFDNLSISYLYYCRTVDQGWIWRVNAGDSWSFPDPFLKTCTPNLHPLSLYKLFDYNQKKVIAYRRVQEKDEIKKKTAK